MLNPVLPDGYKLINPEAFLDVVAIWSDAGPTTSGPYVLLPTDP
jgi:hypothetical protein